jgi:hypothetical protein
MARKWRQAGTQVITRTKSTPAKGPAGVHKLREELGRKKGEIDRELLHW